MGSLLQLHRIIEWMIYEIKREEIANNYSVAHRKKLNSHSVARRRFPSKWKKVVNIRSCLVTSLC